MHLTTLLFKITEKSIAASWNHWGFGQDFRFLKFRFLLKDAVRIKWNRIAIVQVHKESWCFVRFIEPCPEISMSKWGSFATGPRDSKGTSSIGSEVEGTAGSACVNPKLNQDREFTCLSTLSKLRIDTHSESCIPCEYTEIKTSLFWGTGKRRCTTQIL